MDGVGGCGCRLVWGRRGKAQVRELGRGQGNFKLAANFGYGSRGSADPRESLRKRRILKLALTAHKVLPQTVRSAFWLFIGCNCGERKVNSPSCQGHFELV